MKPLLLIVDDDEEIRAQIKWALTDEYTLAMAEDRASAVAAASSKHPMVMLLDLGLPPHPGSPDEGLAAIGELLGLDPFLKIIVVSGQGERHNALKAIGAGAYDFLTKPVDVEVLRVILDRAFYVTRLEREQRAQNLEGAENHFEGMLGTSTGMQQVFSTIRKVAASDAPVLILGESGTGKERTAMAVHRRSSRRDGPFVAINCSAIPETLLESELFGHEKGAFTGAHVQRKGRIETAAGGTLFLDEIGELPPAIQVKLLRFLQEKTIERVGGRVTIEVDARVVAATNVDLKQAIQQGKFREDLFYRLAVVVVRIPPLREREGDVLLMAKSFLRRSTGDKAKIPHFTPQALDAIQKAQWPGNVRELENRIKRAVIMAEGSRITPQDLELDSADAKSGNQRAPQTLREAREAAERELIEATLQRHNGKITPTALELQISRPTLYELMDRLGIVRPERD